MRKWKLDRIISVATLATSVVALVLLLKKPAPVAHALSPAASAASAQSFNQKIQQLDQPKDSEQAPAEVHLNADEVSAAIAEAARSLPGLAAPSPPGASGPSRAPSGQVPVNQSSPDQSASGIT